MLDVENAIDIKIKIMDLDHCQTCMLKKLNLYLCTLNLWMV